VSDLGSGGRRGYRRPMNVEAVVQVNDRDTYRASVRTRTAVAANRPAIEAQVRFFPPGFLTVKGLGVGAPVSVISAAEVFDVTNLERVQIGGE
jgi:hypothetical protein